MKINMHKRELQAKLSVPVMTAAVLRLCGVERVDDAFVHGGRRQVGYSAAEATSQSIINVVVPYLQQ